MNEYLKSTQEDNTYCRFVRRQPQWADEADFYHSVQGLPTDGKVIGEYTVYDSGYDWTTGNTYDECLFDLYETNEN